MAGANMKQINQRQANDAMALLRDFVSDYINSGRRDLNAWPDWMARAEKLVLEVDQLRGRAAYQRWCVGRDGRGFRAGDKVIFAGGAIREVSKIDPEKQLFLVKNDDLCYGAMSVIKQSPTVATPQELEEIGQEVMQFEAELRGGAAA